MLKTQDNLYILDNLKSKTIQKIKELTYFDNSLVNRISEYINYEGKMIRSSFFYIFFFSIFSKYESEVNLDELIKLGAIFELSHSATLVHDDILDSAKKRRGKDAVHIKFGIDGALIFGDILIISTLNKIYDVNPLYAKILMKALENMCFGEVLQYQNKFNVYLTLDQYFNIIELKTGVLFGSIAQVAYHYAYSLLNKSINEEIFNKLYEIFTDYGIAFQIIDDIFDYIKDSKTLKKDSNLDIISGRTTYPLILFLQNKSNKEYYKRIWLKNPSYLASLVTRELKNNRDIINKALYEAQNILNKYNLKDLFEFEQNWYKLLDNVIKSFVFRKF
ncbi:MAG: polyprenyl synthetase family protein [bacterium]